jgi:Chitin synthase export chaperone
MTYVVVVMLREGRPMREYLFFFLFMADIDTLLPVYYASAGILFVLSQLAYFLLSKVICMHSNSKVDGSFIATTLEVNIE